MSTRQILILFLLYTSIEVSSAPSLIIGPSSTKSSQLRRRNVTLGDKTVIVLTVGDRVNGYRMVGKPDGLGAFVNPQDPRTFVLTMNHEIKSNQGITRAHGSKGGFVSKWIIDRATFEVKSGKDLVPNVASGHWRDPKKKEFSSLCSADVAHIDAFYNKNTGLGTQAHLHCTGDEDSSFARAFCFVASGTAEGNVYELPLMGHAKFENVIACPYMQDMTIMVGTNDDPKLGYVVFYIGQKMKDGTEVEKAGLMNGKLYGLKITGYPTVKVFPPQGASFMLQELGINGDITSMSFSEQESQISQELVTLFDRIEDGAWHPVKRNLLYFTEPGSSRLWRIAFTNISSPLEGGKIDVILNATAGKWFDNIGFDDKGDFLLICEDSYGRGNNHLVRYDLSLEGPNLNKNLGSNEMKEATEIIAEHIIEYGPDGEFSGVISAGDVIGPGWFLLTNQAHGALSLQNIRDNDGELLENGQLIAIFLESSSYPVPPVIMDLEPKITTVNKLTNFTVFAYDPNGVYNDKDTIISYEWNFGDGSPSINTGDHCYSKTGQFDITVLVEDTTGLKNTKVFSVLVTPPTPSPTPYLELCNETLWPDVKNNFVCSDCKVLVTNMDTKYNGMCKNYCKSFNHRCVNAWEDLDNDCRVEYKGSCDVDFGITTDAICECEDLCDENSWPDVKDGNVCADCKVLVNQMDTKYNGTCQNYCKSFGFTCVGAWEDAKNDCDVKFDSSCSVIFEGTTDAICECQPNNASTLEPSPKPMPKPLPQCENAVQECNSDKTCTKDKHCVCNIRINSKDFKGVCMPWRLQYQNCSSNIEVGCGWRCEPELTCQNNVCQKKKNDQNSDFSAGLQKKINHLFLLIVFVIISINFIL